MSKSKPVVFPKLSQRQMADFLGTTETRMEWAYRNKIVEREPDGRYRPEAVTPKWLAYERSPRSRSKGRVSSGFERERARLTRLRAEEVSRRLALLDGSLLSTADIVETVKSVCLRIKSKLQAAIPRIARSCYHAPNVNQALKNARSEFDAVIAELSALENGAAAPRQFEVVTGDDTNGNAE
jgi:hypothetical protein